MSEGRKNRITLRLEHELPRRALSLLSLDGLLPLDGLVLWRFNLIRRIFNPVPLSNFPCNKPYF
jgi:hypothetical protein